MCSIAKKNGSQASPQLKEPEPPDEVPICARGLEVYWLWMIKAHQRIRRIVYIYIYVCVCFYMSFCCDTAKNIPIRKPPLFLKKFVQMSIRRRPGGARPICVNLVHPHEANSDARDSERQLFDSNCSSEKSQLSWSIESS